MTAHPSERNADYCSTPAVVYDVRIGLLAEPGIVTRDGHIMECLNSADADIVARLYLHRARKIDNFHAAKTGHLEPLDAYFHLANIIAAHIGTYDDTSRIARHFCGQESVYCKSGLLSPPLICKVVCHRRSAWPKAENYIIPGIGITRSFHSMFLRSSFTMSITLQVYEHAVHTNSSWSTFSH